MCELIPIRKKTKEKVFQGTCLVCVHYDYIHAVIISLQTSIVDTTVIRKLTQVDSFRLLLNCSVTNYVIFIFKYIKKNLGWPGP